MNNYSSDKEGDYAQNLRNALAKNDMSAAQLAKATGINRSTIYNMLRRNTALRFDLAIKVAEVLKIDPATISKSTDIEWLYDKDGVGHIKTRKDYVSDFDKRAKAYITGITRLMDTSRKSPDQLIIELFSPPEYEELNRLLLGYQKLSSKRRRDICDIIDLFASKADQNDCADEKLPEES